MLNDHPRRKECRVAYTQAKGTILIFSLAACSGSEPAQRSEPVRCQWPAPSGSFVAAATSPHRLRDVQLVSPTIGPLVHKLASARRRSRWRCCSTTSSRRLRRWSSAKRSWRRPASSATTSPAAPSSPSSSRSAACHRTGRRRRCKCRQRCQEYLGVDRSED